MHARANVPHAITCTFPHSPSNRASIASLRDCNPLTAQSNSLCIFAISSSASSATRPDVPRPLPASTPDWPDEGSCRCCKGGRLASGPLTEEKQSASAAVGPAVVSSAANSWISCLCVCVCVCVCECECVCVCVAFALFLWRKHWCGLSAHFVVNKPEFLSQRTAAPRVLGNLAAADPEHKLYACEPDVLTVTLRC